MEKKINVGLIGLGKLGKKHAENILRRIPEANLIAVCARTSESVERFAKEYNIKSSYTNYLEMIENPELDGVVIVSPSAFHFSHARAAIEKNLHVFCEKPLTFDLEECAVIENMLKDRTDLIFMLGFMRRFDKSYHQAKKKVENGEIGEPYLIRCYGLDPIYLVKEAVDFAKTSGGIALDMAIHDFDLARWFLNEEAKNVYSIGGCYVEKGFEKHNDFDNMSALVRFSNNKMGMFFASRTITHGYHIETEIVGTKGMLRVSGVPRKNLVSVFDMDGVKEECSYNFIERFEDSFLHEMREFFNCIVNKKEPIVTAKDGTQSTKIALACKQAYITNELIEIE